MCVCAPVPQPPPPHGGVAESGNRGLSSRLQVLAAADLAQGQPSTALR